MYKLKYSARGKLVEYKGARTVVLQTVASVVVQIRTDSELRQIQTVNRVAQPFETSAGTGDSR